ncbi:hypothetical protein [Qipengyuania sp. DGS5-3]|uniref:hypothetical protein n=1 Tax=Qipengyuania sp. DGS5-3 TaxID=3349632 RepID=UPI0036D35CC5
MMKSVGQARVHPLKLAALTAPLSCMFAPAALAQELNDIDFDLALEIRGVESDLDFDEGEEIDSSGIGARVRVGANWQAGYDTSVRVRADASIFEFRDDERDSLDSVGGRVEVTHQYSDEVQVRGFVRRVENVALLEANSADQTSVGARLQWQKDNDRVRVTGEYRNREYDTATGGNGEGYRAIAQYNRRIAPYQWIRFELRHEDNESEDEPRRSYNRQIAHLRYSQPIAKRLRLRPSLEYRQWKYDARIAQGDPEGDLREDNYIAPGVDIAWGSATRGPYATASAEYRFRQSNDERFGSDAVRVGLRVGYRF